MTQSESENATVEGNYSTTERIQSGFKPTRLRIHRWIQRRFNRKPAYRITRHGVKVEYYNFSDTDTLPFDLETYRDTQIFIGSYANPWYVDVEEMEDSYPDFTEQTNITVDDIFGTEYIYPSQRWKMLANTNALSEMFTGRSIDMGQIRRLIYMVMGGIVLLGAIFLFQSGGI